MEQWSLNKLQIESFHLLLENEDISSIFKEVRKRNKFAFNQDIVTVPRYFYRFIGINGDEDEYYNNLLELHNNLKPLNKLYLPLIEDEGFVRNIPSDFQYELNIMWSKLMSLPEFSPKMITGLIDKLLITFPMPNLSKQIRENFEGLVEYYFEVNADEIDPNEFKNILFYSIFWINTYFESLLISFDYTAVNPKVLYYGDITKEEIFFLIFLSSFGCDILYFNPLRSCDFYIIDRDNIFSHEVEYNRKVSGQPFPTAKRIGRVSTIAHTASEEISSVLHTEDSKLYKPWQFMEYNVTPITLKTTYDEIYTWGEQKALIRPAWNIENKVVYIPNLFSKIMGVPDDIDKYWKKIHSLLDEKNVLFFKNSDITNKQFIQYTVSDSNSNQINNRSILPDSTYYTASLNAKNVLDESLIINSASWKYSRLPTHIQKLIANRITELVNNLRIKAQPNLAQNDLKILVFSKLMNIDERFLQLIQKFDYPQEVPKIIIYNSEGESNIDLEDAIMLYFLNSIGMDIIIYNPSGYNDIENYLEEKLFDSHRLEDVAFNLKFKEKSFFNRLFK